jgi:hypothetical protein
VQRIDFRAVPADVGDGTAVEGIVPHIDGVPLTELLRRVELPSARREKKPDLAGSYVGLMDDRVRWPSRHYLGKPVLTWFGDGDTVLLGCTCGEWGCWPFTAIVTVEPDVVTWSGYRNGHRDWDYGGLRDLVFDRTQYERAVRATAG